MTAISDDDLLLIAPNVQVQVWSPPPFESVDFDPEKIPQNIFSILDIKSRKMTVIGNDRTPDLIRRAKKSPINSPIKVYGGSTTAPGSAKPTPPTPDPAPGNLPKSTKASVPNLPDNLPFFEIAYVPKDLVPYPPLQFEVDDPTSYGLFKDFPSAVYINETSSCISTPFYSPRLSRNYNGVANDGRSNKFYGTYFWQCDDRVTREFLAPRPDGIITIVAQDRVAKKPQKEVYLTPGIWEKVRKFQNGNALNAFSLILGITPGAGDNQANEYPWKVKIEFGDVTFELFEGTAEATVSIYGMDTPEKRVIQQSSVKYWSSRFGVNPYWITFIPVYNGLLISDGIPGSSDWVASVKFIPKDKSVDINKEINNIINPPPKSDNDFPQSNLPPMVIVKRDNGSGKYLKKYQTPGIRLTRKDKKIDTGTKLSIKYHRCGGAFQFKPIYFAPFSRYHFIYPGAASPDDLSMDMSKLNPNVFKIKSASEDITMPIFSYESAQYIDFRTNLATIVTDKSKPESCLSLEFQAHNTDVRLPMQVWGAMVMDKVTLQIGITQPPDNQDGFLSVNAISVPRIRSFNINKGLDGSSGDIVWDRFNPLTQQVDSRPFQEVGGIQVAITGGANTIPGVLFTGLAYGNSEEDNPGENLTRIPLKGRESKLTSEGGLALVNVPFFDGYDHRDVMSYMANYAGFPIDVSNTDPFRLISSYNIQNPILDFPVGTAVLQAMDQIATSVGTLFYFDRFGTLIYMSSERSTGVNWNYPDLILENFSDEPDSTWVRNQILIIALVAEPTEGQILNVDYTTIPTQLVLIRIPLVTYPEFAWAKMAVYAIPQIVQDVDEVIRQAVQIAKGQSRPRSTARCRIPGNAQIELMDTINNNWYITSISHQVDIQRKTWSTELGVELIRPDVVEPIEIDYLPLSDLE